MIDLTGCHVLVVDDHQDMRETLAEVLEEDGCTVATAENGKVALSYLKAHPHTDLILLDLMMPEMDGREFRNIQRQDVILSAIPVIILSGADRIEQAENELQAAAYYVKPVEPNVLIEAVASHRRR